MKIFNTCTKIEKSSSPHFSNFCSDSTDLESGGFISWGSPLKYSIKAQSNKEKNFLSSFSQEEKGGMIYSVMVAVIAFGFLIGYIANMSADTIARQNLQNAADSMAYSSAVCLARGMNAICALNHALGEMSAYCVLLDSIGGPETKFNKPVGEVILDGTINLLSKTAPSPAPVLRQIDTKLINFISPLFTEHNKLFGSVCHTAGAATFDSEMTLKYYYTTCISAKTVATCIYILGQALSRSGYGAIIGIPLMIVSVVLDILYNAYIVKIVLEYIQVRFMEFALPYTQYIRAVLRLNIIYTNMQMDKLTGGFTDNKEVIWRQMIDQTCKELQTAYDIGSYTVVPDNFIPFFQQTKLSTIMPQLPVLAEASHGSFLGDIYRNITSEQEKAISSTNEPWVAGATFNVNSLPHPNAWTGDPNTKFDSVLNSTGKIVDGIQRTINNFLRIIAWLYPLRKPSWYKNACRQRDQIASARSFRISMSPNDNKLGYSCNPSCWSFPLTGNDGTPIDYNKEQKSQWVRATYPVVDSLRSQLRTYYMDPSTIKDLDSTVSTNQDSVNDSLQESNKANEEAQKKIDKYNEYMRQANQKKSEAQKIKNNMQRLTSLRRELYNLEINKNLYTLAEYKRIKKELNEAITNLENELGPHPQQDIEELQKEAQELIDKAEKEKAEIESLYTDPNNGSNKTEDSVATEDQATSTQQSFNDITQRVGKANSNEGKFSLLSKLTALPTARFGTYLTAWSYRYTLSESYYLRSGLTRPNGDTTSVKSGSWQQVKGAVTPSGINGLVGQLNRIYRCHLYVIPMSGANIKGNEIWTKPIIGSYFTEQMFTVIAGVEGKMEDPPVTARLLSFRQKYPQCAVAQAMFYNANGRNAASPYAGLFSSNTTGFGQLNANTETGKNLQPFTGWDTLQWKCTFTQSTGRNNKSTTSTVPGLPTFKAPEWDSEPSTSSNKISVAGLMVGNLANPIKLVTHFVGNIGYMYKLIVKNNTGKLEEFVKQLGTTPVQDMAQVSLSWNAMLVPVTSNRLDLLKDNDGTSEHFKKSIDAVQEYNHVTPLNKLISY